MYNSKTIDTFLNSEHIGNVRGASVQGKYKSKEYGDIIKLALKINEDLSVGQAGFKAFGGIAITAYAAKLCEMIEHKPLKSVKDITVSDLTKNVKGLPKEKEYSAELVIKAFRLLVKKYCKKMGLNF